MANQRTKTNDVDLLAALPLQTIDDGRQNVVIRRDGSTITTVKPHRLLDLVAGENSNCVGCNNAESTVSFGAERLVHS